MKSMFEKQAYDEILSRLNKLTPQSPAHWGKMNVAQMLAHVTKTYKMPLSDKKYPRSVLGLLLGWAFKHKLYNDKLYDRNLPTSPGFKIVDERVFTDEKSKLLESIQQFLRLGPEGINKNPHPMFGKFTPQQWGQSMYKHLDHHLRQFGV